MDIKVLNEYGFSDAMLGLSLSFNKPMDSMHDVAKRLYNKDGGHNKFLRMMYVTLDITASRSWWQQMSTYCVGVTTQSESTMHTLTKRKLSQDDFDGGVPEFILEYLNLLIERGELLKAKEILPESFLQRRIVSANYMTIRNIIKQRSNHRLPEWRDMIDVLLRELEHKEFLIDLRKGFYR